jgi:cytochrome c oxidase subunit 3
VGGAGILPVAAGLRFMALEGTGFAPAGGSYLYLQYLAPHWPLSRPVSNLWPGTIVLLILLASLVPNHILTGYAKKCAPALAGGGGPP